MYVVIKQEIVKMTSTVPSYIEGAITYLVEEEKGKVPRASMTAVLKGKKLDFSYLDESGDQEVARRKEKIVTRVMGLMNELEAIKILGGDTGSPEEKIAKLKIEYNEISLVELKKITFSLKVLGEKTLVDHITETDTIREEKEAKVMKARKAKKAPVKEEGEEPVKDPLPMEETGKE
jgi:hypothetical protein